MNDFNIKVGVVADADKNKIQSQLNSQLKNAKVKAAMEITADTKKLRADILKVRNEVAEKFDIQIDNKTALKSIQNTQKAYAQLRKEAYQSIGVKSPELTNMASYYKDLEKQSDSFSKKNINGIDLEIKKRQEASKLFSQQIKSQMQERISAENIIQTDLNLASGKTNLSNGIESYLKNNSKMSKESRAEFVKLKNSIKDVDQVGLKNANSQFKELKGNISALGQTGDSTFTRLGKNVKQFASFISAATVAMTVLNAVRGTVSTVVELDKSLVDLQQATGYNQSQAKELLNTYIDLGQELGATGSEVANSAGQWLRQGKSIADTNTLIKDSMVLSKIGQIESADATNFLTTASKGYGVAVKDVIGIVDKLSAVDLVSATSAGSLAEGMSQVANNANMAGISMDKLLGYLAIIGETSGESMSAVGNSLSTMFSRMGNIKLARLKDYQNSGEDLSNVETVLRGLNIELRESDDTFRNFGGVLDDVSGKWLGYSDVNKRAVASAIAGKDHMEDFLILMNNYGKATEYSTVATESSGKAMEKFGNYSESVEAKTKTLQASLQELATDTLNSGVIKGFLDGSNILVNFADNVGLSNIALVTFLGVVGSKVGIFKTLADQISLAMIAQTGYTVETTAAAYAQVGLTGAIQATGKAMKLFLLTNPIGMVVGITAAVASLFAIQDLLTVSLKEQEEKIVKLEEEYSKLQTRLSEINSELQTTTDRINELNAKDNLTFVEQSELDNLIVTNGLLESQNRLLKDQADLKNREVADEIAVKYNNDFGEEFQSITKSDKYTVGTDTYNTPKIISEGEYVKELISEYERLSKIDKSLIAEDDLKKLDKYKASLIDYGVEINDYADRYKIDDETSQSWRDFASLIDKTLNPAAYKTKIFDEVFNSDSFSKVKEELQSLASSGTLTPEILSSTEKYRDLLSETGLTAQDVSDQINSMMSETSNAANALSSAFDSSIFTSLSTALSSLESNSKDAITSLGDLNQIISDQADGTNLTAEAAYNLIQQYPQLASALEKTTDGYTINEEAITNVRDAILDQEKINATSQINMTKDTLNAISDRVEGYGIELEAIKSISSAQTEQGKLDWNKVYGTMDGTSFDDASKRVTTPSGSFIARTEEEYKMFKDSYDEQKSIYDLLGNMGGLQERINGLQGGLLSDDKFGVSDSKGSKPEDTNLDAFNEAKANLEHRRKMGLSDKTYYKELTDFKTDYLSDTKKYASEIWAIDEEVFNHNKDLSDKAKQDSEDLIKSKFDSLEHDHAMNKVLDEEYYKTKMDYANTYYKNDKDHLEDYRSILEEFNDWELSEAKKVVEETEKKRVNAIDNIIEKYSELRDAINNTAEGQEGIVQVSTYSDGIKSARNEIKYLENEIKNLSKIEISDTFTQDDYDSRLNTLQSALTDAKKSITEFMSSISESIQKEQDDVVDAIDTGHEKLIKSLEEEKDAYADINKAQQELIDLKEEQRDYENSIADKTKEISQIESRMAELQKAASSGDREASAELAKLNEDVTDKKKDLTEEQHDHEIDLQKDALDKALDDNNKIADAKIELIKSEHETQLANVQKLYEKEIELAKNAAQYTKEQYAIVLKEITDGLSINGIVQSPEYIQSLKDAQEQGSNANKVNSILGTQSEANKKVDTSKVSDLSSYIVSLGYGIPTKEKMVELAKVLNVSGVNSVKDVGTDDISKLNKSNILQALIKAKGFKNGGTVSLQDMIVRAGEDGVGIIRRREEILTPEKAMTLDKFTSVMPKISDLIKLNTPNLSNITTNNNSSSPTVQIYLPESSNIDNTAINNWKQFVPQLTQAVSKELINVKRQYK